MFFLFSNILFRSLSLQFTILNLIKVCWVQTIFWSTKKKSEFRETNKIALFTNNNYVTKLKLIINFQRYYGWGNRLYMDRCPWYWNRDHIFQWQRGRNTNHQSCEQKGLLLFMYNIFFNLKLKYHCL